MTSLFRGRYKAIVIDASNYLLQVSRYIHRNPIDLKKPLVTHLEDYLWSSYSAYINNAKVYDWLNRDTVYAELGSRKKYNAYRRYVEQGNDDETEHFYQLKNTPAIWGDKSFKEYAQDRAQSLDTEVDKKGLRSPVALPKIIQAVARYYDQSEKDICVAKRGRRAQNIPRWIAMKLCQEVGGATLMEIADVFHVGHYSTVSQTIGRLNGLMSTEPEMAIVLSQLGQELIL